LSGSCRNNTEMKEIVLLLPLQSESEAHLMHLKEKEINLTFSERFQNGVINSDSKTCKAN
jgi:hypothetical protein